MADQVTQLETEPEPFIISLAEASWLAKALSADVDRPVLALSALGNWDGSAVIAATDTYRLHILRLGDVPEGYPLAPMTRAVPFGNTAAATKLLDLRRVIHEARYAKAKQIAISRDLSDVRVGVADSKQSRWEPVYGPVFPEGVGSYPQFVRVIPEGRRPVAELFAINSRYLADATLLTREAAMKTVIWCEGGQRQPLVFQPAQERPRWMAVVMQMRLDCTQEEKSWRIKKEAIQRTQAYLDPPHNESEVKASE